MDFRKPSNKQQGSPSSSSPFSSDIHELHDTSSGAEPATTNDFQKHRRKSKTAAFDPEPSVKKEPFVTTVEMDEPSSTITRKRVPSWAKNLLNRLNRKSSIPSTTPGMHSIDEQLPPPPPPPQAKKISKGFVKDTARSVYSFVREYGKFIGPGFMISVAYMDPGNYSTDVAAGAEFRFYLLFVVLLSNCIAVFLQSLAIKLGTVSGRDLAQVSRDEFPRWLNIILYIIAEIAIICTDIAEVIGTAVALNILLKIPLIAGVFITIIDVLLVLLAHKPGNSMSIVYMFEYGVAALVMGVVVCFAVMLSRIPSVPVGEVLKGYLPSSHLIEGNALYAACGILGATVMPHSLYLGSAIVKPRLLDYDLKHGNVEKETQNDIEDGFYELYRPSVPAINYALKFSIIELTVSLFTFALFVNSAILIVAGATIYGSPDANTADLYSIHATLSDLLSNAAGTIFMLALLFSGQSAGIICTIAGQIVSEGYLNWTLRPWLRRIITRSIAIVPCVVVAGAVGRKGLTATLNATQVALSILLPFLVGPLIYFTCKSSIMTIKAGNGIVDVNDNSSDNDNECDCIRATSNTRNPERLSNNQEGPGGEILENEELTDELQPEKVISSINYRAGPTPTTTVSFKNSWLTMAVGILVWLFISVLNVYLLVCLGRGIN